jgi:hypothetical protein
MLKFRPHHFLCTVGYQGKGYSPEFVKNYDSIAADLKKPAGDGTLIQVVEKTDSICAPCPSKRDDLCETQAKIDQLDRAHANILSIKDGDTLTWGEAKNRIAEFFTEEAFESACAPCSWKALGICKTALVKLKNEHQDSTHYSDHSALDERRSRGQ